MWCINVVEQPLNNWRVGGVKCDLFYWWKERRQIGFLFGYSDKFLCFVFVIQENVSLMRIGVEFIIIDYLAGLRWCRYAWKCNLST